MSNHNLYLKQISCLERPVNNQDWHEITHFYPATLHCLVDAASQSARADLALKGKEPDNEKQSREEASDEPIPWCDVKSDDAGEDNSTPFQLERFFYDCSYLSPFVGKVYSREHSEKGWYRWVGPDPVLEVRIPLAPVKTESWVFTTTFHAFLDDADAQNIHFEVNGKSMPLEWLEGSIYQSRIAKAELFINAQPGEAAVAHLSIGIPEARQTSNDDQRMLAFAIRELTLFPA